MTCKRSKAARWSIAVLVCAAWAGTAGAEPPSLLPTGWDAGLTLVLSDIGFDRNGKLESADSGGPAGMVFGREGGYLLANGKVMPTLRARAGAPQRWRIVNAAKSRYFLLDLEGQPFSGRPSRTWRGSASDRSGR